MDKLRNLSIRKSVILYIFISLFVSLLLWIAAYGAATFVVQVQSAKEISDDSVYYDGNLPARADFS